MLSPRGGHLAALFCKTSVCIPEAPLAEHPMSVISKQFEFKPTHSVLLYCTSKGKQSWHPRTQEKGLTRYI